MAGGGGQFDIELELAIREIDGLHHVQRHDVAVKFWVSDFRECRDDVVTAHDG
jgi:hypothetical protein